jgi:MFS transporter, NNP family, nitrate/nitrite transporter
MKVLYLALFWSLWFLIFSTRTSLSPLLPVIEDELLLSHARAGGLYLALAIGYTLSLLLSGIVAPRVGYKRSIQLGFVLLSLSLFSLWYVNGYLFLTGIFFLVGAAGGLYLPSAIPLITKLFEPQHWGKSLALHDTAASISILSIPFLTTLALGFFPWQGFYLVLAGACVVTLVLFSLAVPNAPPQQDEERGNLAGIIKRPEFWVMVGLWMVAATASMGLYSIIPLFLVKGKGISLGTANMIFGFSRVGGVVATLLAGVLVDRFGIRRLLLVVFLITGASTVGIALAPSFLFLVVMLFVQAPLSNAFFPVGLVAISRLSHTGERSLFTGATISGGTIAGIGLAPLCLGAAADVWSFQAGILVAGGVIMAAAVLPCLLRDI